MSFVAMGIEDAIAECEYRAKDVTRFVRESKTRLQRAIDAERNNHAYQNRTHNAETNTLLVQVGSGLDADLRAEMHVDYASFLQKNGWSKFKDLVEAAFKDIDAKARGL